MFNKIQIEFNNQAGFSSKTVDGIRHKKTLPFLSVVQAVEGSYDISLNGKDTRNTGEGGFFIAPSNVMQTITHNTNKSTGVMTARWVFLNVKVNGFYYIDSLLDFPVILPESKRAELNAAFDEIFRENVSVCDRYIVYYKIIKILISVSNPKNNGENSECFKALEYIKENYQRPITVSELSANANMSEASFYRLFKKQVGNSPIKYLNNYRLSLAADMLVNTELSVQAISEDVGIPDPVYFNKLFKRNYQMPPSKYRKVYSGR